MLITFVAMSEKLVLSVKGMTCNSCAQGISRHLEKKGLQEVFVSYENETVEVPDPGNWTTSEVAEEINKLGYQAATTQEINLKSPRRNQFSRTDIYFFVSALFTLPLLLHMISGFAVLHLPWFQFMLATPVMIIGFIYFGRSAIGSIRSGSMNMDVLIATGSFSAYLYSVVAWYLASVHTTIHPDLYFETGATIITLVLLGNIIEQRSLKKTRSAMESLSLLQPQTALRIDDALTDNEHTHEIQTDKLKINDLLLIPNGARIPADGMIYSGSGVVDESGMTGESIPVNKQENDFVYAGTILQDGILKMIVQKSGHDTLLSRMIEMVRTSTRHKPSIQRFGDRVSARFVPVVLLISVLTFFIQYYLADHSLRLCLMSAIAVLVISCPCAMGLATPTAVAVGVGLAARRGILIKGGDILEKLNQAEVFVFDKTGTLTKGKLKLLRINYHAEESLVNYLFGKLEQHSTHPAALPLKSAFENATYTHPVLFIRISEIKGVGVEAYDSGGNHYIAGSYKIAAGITSDAEHQVYLLKNNILVATADLEDELRPSAEGIIRWLKSKGKRTVLLSGDRLIRCERIAGQIGIDEVYAEQLPDDKVACIRRLQLTSKVVMIGDGINDAPSLAEAFVGISPGSGTQVAMQSSDIILMGADPLLQIPEAMAVAAHTFRTIRQNLFWALIYNIIAIPVAATGLLSPVIASLSMAFSDVIVIGNSTRLRFKRIFTSL